MIPKKIHYCWFGKKPLPKEVLKYMESWRKYLPDCEIKEWNEENFDVNQFKYTKEAYFAKKYAFVSDVARLQALVSEGGLYLDTDILILKPLDPYLWSTNAFIGFEHDTFIGTGVIASKADHPLFKDFLSSYKSKSFFKGLNYNEETNVSQITDFFSKKGLIRNNTKQIIEDVVVYPQNYFCNKNWYTGQYYNDKQSYTIHDYQSSWCERSSNLLHRIKRKIKKILTISTFFFENLFSSKNFNK